MEHRTVAFGAAEEPGLESGLQVLWYQWKQRWKAKRDEGFIEINFFLFHVVEKSWLYSPWIWNHGVESTSRIALDGTCKMPLLRVCHMCCICLLTAGKIKTDIIRSFQSTPHIHRCKFKISHPETLPLAAAVLALKINSAWHLMDVSVWGWVGSRDTSSFWAGVGRWWMAASLSRGFHWARLPGESSPRVNLQ